MPTNILLTGQQFCATIPSNATSVVFCNEIAPTGVSLIDVSEAQDNSIVAWLDGTAYKVSTQMNEVKVLSNPDSSYMFSAKPNLKEFDFTSLNTKLSTDMSYMFYQSTGLETIDVSSFNTENVTTMECMFASDSSSNIMKLNSINFGSNFDTSKVTSFYRMFRFCSLIKNIDVSGFNTKSAIDMTGMFDRCNKLEYVDVSNFITDNVKSMRVMFQLCYVINNIDVSKWNTSNCEDMSYMFNNCKALTELKAENFNTSKVKTMKQMLQQCNSLKSFSVKNWDVSNCEDLSFLFYGCSSFKSVDFDNWDVRNNKTFDHFLAHSKMEDFDVSKWQVTSACTNLNAIFHSTRETYIDVTGWDTSNVIAFNQIFDGMGNLQKVDGLETWNTSNGVCFGEMFSGCGSLKEIDLSSFDTRKTDQESIVSTNHFVSYGLQSMFAGCSGLEKLSLGKYFTRFGNGTLSENNYAYFPTPASGYWYTIDGSAYAPADVPALTSATYYASEELAKEALIELHKYRYMSLNSLRMFHEKHNAEINVKLEELQLEANSFEEITNDEILSLFI